MVATGDRVFWSVFRFGSVNTTSGLVVSINYVTGTADVRGDDGRVIQIRMSSLRKGPEQQNKWVRGAR